MNPIPELIPMLKQLRLSGILDSLEVRNRQAIEEQFAYTDFLAMLIQDEVARRTQRKLAMAMRRANFRSHKTMEDFDFSFNPKINRAQVLDLATCRFMEEKACILVAGPCGTGKSHLAQALGHCAIRLGYDVLFVSQTKMFGQLHAARATNSYDRRLAALAKVDLLIIDDFGLKPLRSPQDEDFHDLIAERYERKGTIITSNLDLSEWGDAFPNKLLGAATIDRIRHGAYSVILDGKSFRSEKILPSTPKSTIVKGGKTN
jgi:DNA replication protein DnaC